MKVRELMTTPVSTCRTTALLGDAAKKMRELCLGCVPVVDKNGKLAGMLTDRDVCLAIAERPRNPSAIPIRDVMSPNVISCLANDDLDVALVAMKERGVRRVPVVDEKERVRGLLSIDDVILGTGAGRGTVPAEAVLDVLRHICSPDDAAFALERSDV